MFRTIADTLVRDTLVVRLSRLTPASTRRWGTLTPHEMLCHLGDATAMVLGDRPRPSPIAPRGRTPIKALFLWSPMRWPHGIPTSPRHDPRREGTRRPTSPVTPIAPSTGWYTLGGADRRPRTRRHLRADVAPQLAPVAWKQIDDDLRQSGSDPGAAISLPARHDRRSRQPRSPETDPLRCRPPLTVLIDAVEGLRADSAWRSSGWVSFSRAKMLICDV